MKIKQLFIAAFVITVSCIGMLNPKTSYADCEACGDLGGRCAPHVICMIEIDPEKKDCSRTASIFGCIPT